MEKQDESSSRDIETRVSSMSDSTIDECLETLINQDDNYEIQISGTKEYLMDLSKQDDEKLKEENEHYRQELHVLRLALQTSEAVNRDLQESNNALEQKVQQYMTMVDKKHDFAAKK